MKKKVIWWLAVVLWCIMIFYQSSKPAVVSSGESGFITMTLNRLLACVFGEGKIFVKDVLTRKSGHFIEYTVLACLLFNSLKNADKLIRTAALSIIFAVAYAITDEIHQYFIPGRAMRAFDIGIDTLGIILGTGILYMYNKRKSPVKIQV